jgi:hypothetical protein
VVSQSGCAFNAEDELEASMSDGGPSPANPAPAPTPSARRAVKSTRRIKVSPRLVFKRPYTRPRSTPRRTDRFLDVFARMHTLETTVEGHDRGLELVREILPWLRESTGFRALLRLATPDRSKTVVITLWADESALLESAEAGRDLGALVTEAAGTTRIALEDYEVTFFEGELTRKDLRT